MHLRKLSLIIIVLYTFVPLYSQFNTYSPYTRFGLGDFSRRGFGQNQAMGGTGIAVHNKNRINPLNPAASAALDSTSVYFDFGANVFFNQYSTGNGDGNTPSISNSWWNMNLHHVAFATSVGKYFGFGAGIVPYSSIGYNIKTELNDYDTGTAMDTHYTGDGGIMNFYLGTSVRLFNRVALGVTMNYLMGRLTRTRVVEFPINSDFSTASTQANFDLRQPVFGFGLQYREVIRDKYFFSLGAVYDLETGVSAKRKYEVVNTIYSMDPIQLNDSVTITPEYYLVQDTTRRKFTIPQKIGIGVSFGIIDKFTVTGDYYRQDWTGSFSTDPGFRDSYLTTDASSLHFGMEYIPDVEALRGYHKYISYRIGGYISNSYLSVLKPGTTDDYYQLEDYGITFGVGLPVRSIKSSINVAFTLGTRGTRDYNLVKENYGIITFNVTLHDLWFRKRRFD